MGARGGSRKTARAPQFSPGAHGGRAWRGPESALLVVSETRGHECKADSEEAFGDLPSPSRFNQARGRRRRQVTHQGETVPNRRDGHCSLTLGNKGWSDGKPRY